jgi:hypothetical protein
MTQTDWLRGQTLVADDLDLAFGRCIDRAGDIMTGEFQLAGDPLKAMDAATKHYVDQRVAGGASLIISDTPPVATSPGLMWFDSVGAQTYMWYSDANSSQWVPLNAPPALAAAVAYLPLGGGTMTGPIVLPGDPTTALQSSTKQYVDTHTAAAVAPALNAVGRSYIHNGLMNVAQRGAGPWTTNGYTVDRWQRSAVLDTASVQQSPFVPGTMVLDEAAKFYLQNIFTGNAGATAYNAYIQPIEDVTRLSNKTVTVSFYAQAQSGAPKLGVSVDQYFGTGGSPSATVNGTGQAVALTNAFARYSLTFTLPSIAGKTLGTNNDHFTQLFFWFSSGATNNARAGSIGVQSATVYLWGVQLEVGPTATPLEKPDPQQDLAKCQRFYQAGGFVNLNGYSLAGNGVMASTLFPVVMRATPTIVPTYNGQSNISTPSMTASASGTTLYGVGTASGGFILNASFTASADL